MPSSSIRDVGFVLAVAFTAGCRRAERLPVSAPVPVRASTAALSSAATSYAQAVEPTWTPEPQLLPPTPVIYGYTIEVPVRASPTPLDVSAIPNFDRPRDPTPTNRTEQLARCLSYRVTLDPTFSSSRRVRLQVRAQNTCGIWVPAEDSRFEVVASPVSGGGTGGREVGMFQAAIPPNSSHVETVIEIDCPAPAGGCQYSASVWWAAGGGRRVE